MSFEEPRTGGESEAPDPRDQPGPPDPQDQLSEEEELRAARNANRFDIRRIIGGVFLVYGTLLTVMGIVGSHHIKTKAAGININLWTGIGMIIFAVFMITWALT